VIRETGNRVLHIFKDERLCFNLEEMEINDNEQDFVLEEMEEEHELICGVVE
jgi:hypothetical protein